MNGTDHQLIGCNTDWIKEWHWPSFELKYRLNATQIEWTILPSFDLHYRLAHRRESNQHGSAQSQTHSRHTRWPQGSIFQLYDARCVTNHLATMSWGGHISYQQATSRAQLVVAHIGSIKISSSRVGVTLWETCSNLQVLPCLLNVDGHCWRSSCNQYRSMDTTEKVIVTNITVSTAQVLLKTTLWTKEAFRAGCLVAPAHKLNCNPKPRKSNKHWTAMLQISPWDHAGERLSNHTEPNSFEWTLHRLHLMIKVSKLCSKHSVCKWH